LQGAVTQFFKNGIMYEWICEDSNDCNYDQQSFKAYLSRWMAATTKVASWTADTIMPLLRSSAEAAAKQCSGTGDYEHMCGLRWQDQGTWDGTSGVGEQMAAMEIFQSNLVHLTAGPLTPDTGATSKSEPSAGNPDSTGTAPPLSPITTGDKAGAVILTLLVISGTLVGTWWLVKN
jgi:mannan endo-1,6-alpha-mannosidase